MRSPDYVNINLAHERLNYSDQTIGDNSEKSVHQRAEPVFIENHDGFDEIKKIIPSDSEKVFDSAKINSDQKLVCNDSFYATRDPYYVSDVQMPAANDLKTSDDMFYDYQDHYREKEKSDPEYANTITNFNNSYTNNHCEESEYILSAIGGEKSVPSSSSEKDDTRGNPSRESSIGYASYDSHLPNKIDSLTSHSSHRGAFQDDTSIGKYSDSGYDTLRAEMSLKRNEKRTSHGSIWTTDSLESSPDTTGVLQRRGYSSRSNRRPETWSPEKFERSWVDDDDSKSKVDESKIVREYSYEYITPEKDNQRSSEKLSQIPLSMKTSTPNLPSLESPRIVQETQIAAQKSLVQDRIKTFSSSVKSSYIATPCEIEDNMRDIKRLRHPITNSIENLNEPLTPISLQTRSQEALVSPLKAEFATSETTVVTALEAHVKNISDYKGNEASLLETPNRYFANDNAQHQNHEQKDVKSPQDLMDSRLNRTNLRKFLFNEDPNSNSSSRFNFENDNHENDKSKNSQKATVKNLLLSFETRTREQLDSSHMTNGSFRRRFHSDSEILSNDSFSDDDRIDEFKAPTNETSRISSASNVLADLRKSADENKDESLYPLCPPPRPPKKPTLRGEMNKSNEKLRHSLAESIDEALRQLDSDTEENTNEWNDSLKNYSFSHTDVNSSKNEINSIDLHKPPTEQAPPPPGKLSSPSYGEENYLPMSPPKKPGYGSSVLGTGSSTSSLSSKHLTTPEPTYPDNLTKSVYEEHTYIEMTGEIASKHGCTSTSSLPNLSTDTSRHFMEYPKSPESPRYYEIGEKEDQQHYEYIYRTNNHTSHYEAIYMEVPNSEKNDDKKETKPRLPVKPQELQSKQTLTKKYASESALTLGSKLETNIVSEASSDADDEASKDFDTLVDPPRNPRFSLSDTFRPASYYLSGAEPSSDPDAQDSSDSDLVSPPPIPLSPPPMDDLETSGPRSNTFDFENLDTPEPPPHLRNALNTSRSLRTSQTSVKEDLNVSTSLQTPSKHKSHEKADSTSSLHYAKFKRRPVLEETIECLNGEDSFILRSEDRYPASAAYPEDNNMPPINTSGNWDKRKPFNQSLDDILLPGDKHEASARPKSVLDQNLSFQNEFDASFLSNKLESSHINDSFSHSAQSSFNNSGMSPVPYSNANSSGHLYNHSDMPLDHRPRSPDPYAEQNELMMYQNLSQKKSIYHSKSPRTLPNGPETSDSPMIDALRGNKTPVTNMTVSHQRTSSEASSRSLTSPVGSIGGGSTGPIHLRVSSNVSMGSEPSPRTAPYYYSDVIRDDYLAQLEAPSLAPRARSYQLNNQRDLEANKRQDIGRKVNQIRTSLENDHRRDQLANELRTSVEILEGKTIASLDERNMYEADTLRKFKQRSHTPDPEIETKNLYPYGLSNKSDPNMPSFSAGHRRTRSLEGLLDDNGRNSWNPQVLTNSSQSPKVDISSHQMQWGHSESNHTVVNSYNQSPVTPTNSSYKGHNPGQRSSVSSSHSTNMQMRGIHSPNPTSPIPYPASPSMPMSGSRDSLVSRESVASRLSHYDQRNHLSPVSDDIGESNNWEDDMQWREQLRRASLRHTRSLETLDEPRTQRSNDRVSSPEAQNRPPPKLSLPNSSNRRVDGNSRSNRNLDEYHVDYREGRVFPSKPTTGHSETIERARRGMTCLEGYEWDAAEERFTKPPPPPPSKPSLMNHHENLINNSSQPFLVDGLPTSSEKGLECYQSPLSNSKTEQSLQLHLEHSSMEGADNNSFDSSGGEGRQHYLGLRDTSSTTTTYSNSPTEPTITTSTVFSTVNQSVSTTGTLSDKSCIMTPTPDVVPSHGKWHYKIFGSNLA